MDERKTLVDGGSNVENLALQNIQARIRMVGQRRLTRLIQH